MTIVQGPVVMTLARAEATAALHHCGPRPPPAAVPAASPSTAPVASATPADGAAQPRNWPSFRGDAASGNGDGQGAVTNGTWPAAQHQVEDRRFPASRTRAPSSGAIASSPRRRSARQATRPSAPARTATSSRSTTCRRTSGRSTASTSHRQSAVGAHGLHRCAEDETAHQGQSGELDAGHRRAARRRRVRLGGACWSRGTSTARAALACHARHGRQRMVLRSDLSMGTRQLARHLPQSSGSPGGHAEGAGTSRPGTWRLGQAGLEDARQDEISTWGTPTLVRLPTGGTSSSRTARRSVATIRRPASCCGRSVPTPRSPSPRRSSATASSSSPGGYPPVQADLRDSSRRQR